MRLSVIIPIADLPSSPERANAFLFVRERLKRLDPHEVIVVRQVQSEACREVRSDGEALLTLTIPGPFAKCALINAGAAAATGDTLLILDGDVVLRWRAVRAALAALRPGQLLKPFQRVWRLSQSQTDDAYAGRRVVRADCADSVNVLCGGAFGIRTDDWADSGGADERFVGWGWEDVELGRRLSERLAVVELPVPAYHLWHPPADRNGPDARRNRALLGRITGGRSGGTLDDTALVYTYYGDSPARREAVRRSLEHLRQLDPMPHVVFVEAGSRVFEDTFTGWPGARYHHIELGPEHAGLMLKEGLYDFALWHLLYERFAVFADPDAFPEHPDLIARIRAELIRLGREAAVQGFSSMTDDGSRVTRPSYASQRVAGQKWCSACPGLIWGFHTEFARMSMQGWNPWCICGSGDGMFVLEHVADPRYPTHTSTDLPTYRAVYRPNQPQVTLGVVEEHMTHCDHGPRRYDEATGAQGRGYTGRWHIIEHFGPDAIREHCTLDGRGLLRWREPGSFMQMALARKGECESPEEAAMIVSEARRGLHLVRHADYLRVAKTDEYYRRFDRWTHYYTPAMEVLRQLPEEICRRGVLEIGPGALPLDRNSTVMDLRDHGVPRTAHDARETPWPFTDRQFGVVVMLHVLEHLDGRQPQALAEIARIADIAVLAIPYRWTSGTPHHRFLGERTMLGWMAGLPCASIQSQITGPEPWQQLLTVWHITPKET